MISLSQETEDLAKRLAAAQRLSVEDAIRLALVEKARALTTSGLVSSTTSHMASPNGARSTR